MKTKSVISISPTDFLFTRKIHWNNNGKVSQNKFVKIFPDFKTSSLLEVYILAPMLVF